MKPAFPEVTASKESRAVQRSTVPLTVYRALRDCLESVREERRTARAQVRTGCSVYLLCSARLNRQIANNRRLVSMCSEDTLIKDDGPLRVL